MTILYQAHKGSLEDSIGILEVPWDVKKQLPDIEDIVHPGNKSQWLHPHIAQDGGDIRMNALGGTPARSKSKDLSRRRQDYRTEVLLLHRSGF